ncbi:MAG: hypothetical protein QM820_00710 [Minicystis sp.]
MSTARARSREEQDDGDGVALSVEEEAEILDRVAETDEDIRAGRAITWEKFLAERERRRAG